MSDPKVSLPPQPEPSAPNWYEMLSQVLTDFATTEARTDALLDRIDLR